MGQDILGVVGALLIGGCFATGLIFYWIKSTSSDSKTLRTLMHEAEGSITFLFDDTLLVDATPRAYELLRASKDDRSDWEAFLTLLSARFPLLRSQLSTLAEKGHMKIAPSDNQTGWIDAEYWRGLARLTLVQDRDHPNETVDPLTAAAMEHELETLRGIGENSPMLIWKRDAEGVLVWANRAYIELSETIFPLDDNEIRPWPPKEIFVDASKPAGTAPIIEMHRIDFMDHTAPTYFEITSLKRGTDTIHFAVDSTAVVTAQDAQRNFVQTLTKTFAQLSVGLAIFDSDRRLVMFNPALLDLTELPSDFLIARPTLFAFLDRLRDQQRMPEPKNYSNWRDNMVELENAAEEGSYHERWLLPNGQTFRVSGKPHPDGAIAFLFEDISEEISLTRKFRSQIDVSAAVFDNLDAAIAVFSSAGSLIMSNTAYRALWGGDADGILASREFEDELKVWQGIASPSPVWVKLTEAVNHASKDMVWDDIIRVGQSLKLTCQYAALPDGNHQIMFSRLEEAEPEGLEFSSHNIALSRKASG
ncbi:PAS-domain containing protein [Pseudooctadecabacter jejudonensis]|uniref:Sensor protein DivL n=1 Tax=Pseudooctadecabacter jejudonensis TaxID=1391910 RepID=A0A1Y5SAE3_9RHOB|nr:PAS-domain containing protein [Pseudooctadecabacter jejudonensis]SLN33267.1 Sensor protein DivL [Pseudooctadecabacter jejudonensis]